MVKFISKYFYPVIINGIVFLFTSFMDFPLVVHKNTADFVLVSELLEAKSHAIFVFCGVNAKIIIGSF